MTCSLHRATDAEIDRLIKEPGAVANFLGFDEPPLKPWRPGGMVGFLRLLPGTICEEASEPAAAAPVPVTDPDRSIDIEKGWHGLHFLFTGSADEGEEPACYLVRGGQDLDDEGHARALRPNQVRRFAVYLSALTPAELERRYDPARMTKLEIYPDVIWMRPAAAGEAPLEWLIVCVSDVQSFVNKVGRGG